MVLIIIIIIVKLTIGSCSLIKNINIFPMKNINCNYVSKRGLTKERIYSDILCYHILFIDSLLAGSYSSNTPVIVKKKNAFRREKHYLPRKSTLIPFTNWP